MEFRDLLVDHDYYCSDNNYYSNDVTQEYETFQDFFNGFKDIDVDLNLIFRWDIKQNDDKTFNMQVFVIQQRKGIFVPHIIENVYESDFENIKSLLQPHLDKLMKIWQPFNPSI